jgi:hypothetical protein
MLICNQKQLIDTCSPCKRKFEKLWKPQSLKKMIIANTKIKMGGFEAKRCYIQLGPMGVNNVFIEGGFFN